uniref:C-type lectin domain-containing protein n=1 Tax=Seriola dumerili TaxID=41447 RepID=A0A3B4TQA1_SERDU
MAVFHLNESDATFEVGETLEHSCPQSWLMFGSSCYYISSQRKSWDDSRQDCVQRNADLVIINSRQEQVPLLSPTPQPDGFFFSVEGTWIWPDGAFGGEDCGDLHTMINFIGLNDFKCSTRNQWICEKTLT